MLATRLAVACALCLLSPPTAFAADSLELAFRCVAALDGHNIMMVIHVSAFDTEFDINGKPFEGHYTAAISDALNGFENWSAVAVSVSAADAKLPYDYKTS